MKDKSEARVIRRRVKDKNHSINPLIDVQNNSYNETQNFRVLGPTITSLAYLSPPRLLTKYVVWSVRTIRLPKVTPLLGPEQPFRRRCWTWTKKRKWVWEEKTRDDREREVFRLPLLPSLNHVRNYLVDLQPLFTLRRTRVLFVTICLVDFCNLSPPR